MAVLVAAACANPRQVIYLAFLIPVPLWVMVIVFVLLDAQGLLQLVNWQESGGVAVACHLGGATFGYLYHRNAWRLSGVLGWLSTKRPAALKLRATP